VSCRLVTGLNLLTTRREIGARIEGKFFKYKFGMVISLRVGYVRPPVTVTKGSYLFSGISQQECNGYTRMYCLSTECG
jgi:hypothetical protein